MAQRKVLIVEEESSVRNLIYTLLGRLGCNGDVAYSGQQALAMIYRQPFRCCIAGLEMFGSNAGTGVRDSGDSSQSGGARSGYHYNEG
jgi:CheY-like chemotaxis protein